MNGLKIKVVKNPTVTLDILSSMLCFFDCIVYFCFLDADTYVPINPPNTAGIRR